VESCENAFKLGLPLHDQHAVRDEAEAFLRELEILLNSGA